MRAVVPAARDALTGMVVRKQTPGGPPHRIISRIPLYEIPEHPSTVTGYLIKTNHGEWRFDENEPLVFPRREDGRRVDWRRLNHYPKMIDLAVGDMLPPRDPAPADDPRFEQAPPAILESMTESWERNYQIVKSIYADRRGYPRMWISTVAVEDQTIRRYGGAATEEVKFPNWEPRGLTHDRNGNPYPVKAQYVPPQVYTGYGPYEKEEGILYAAEHPTGRGRWPRDLNIGVNLGDGVVLRRVYPQEWAQMKFGGRDAWQRHPKDPLYGKAHLTPEEAETRLMPIDEEQYLEIHDVYRRYQGDNKYEGDDKVYDPDA